ncbi:MAG TPA: M23 family metallopeptidase [Rubrivivax sp.]|nr:M23 family metallopeptidase [Rubrivivax sp.]
MQILITHGTLASTRVLHFERWQLVAGALALLLAMVVVSGAVYHAIFVKAARERWPVVSQIVHWVVQDDLASQERYLRENLDAMAHRVGELQAQLVALQVMGERVAAMAGIAPGELQPESPPAPPDAATPATATRPGAAAAPATAATAAMGGPFRDASPGIGHEATLSGLDEALKRLDERAALNADIFTYVESRLLQGRLQSLLVPSIAPVDGYVGSRFGFRYDPFNGRRALHTGQDYPAPVGTPIVAAAGGVVVSTDTHPEYGKLLVVDHGEGLVTRYAHASRILVAAGDIVRRGQVVAEVGSTGRSTGPHLHFEVLVDGVPHNPARFLARGAAARDVQARVLN